MNKEFSQIVRIYLQNQVSEITAGVIVPKPGQLPIVCFALPFSVDHRIVASPASSAMQSTVTLHVDKLSKQDADTLAIARKAFVELSADATVQVMGVGGFPARLSCTPGLNTDTVEIIAQVPLRLFSRLQGGT